MNYDELMELKDKEENKSTFSFSKAKQNDSELSDLTPQIDEAKLNAIDLQAKRELLEKALKTDDKIITVNLTDEEMDEVLEYMKAEDDKKATLAISQKRGGGFIDAFIQNDKSNRQTRQPTGLIMLDNKIGGGFANGCLYVVAGGTSIGKTALMLKFAKFASENDRKVFYVNCEMTLQQTVARLISYESAGKLNIDYVLNGGVQRFYDKDGVMLESSELKENHNNYRVVFEKDAYKEKEKAEILEKLKQSKMNQNIEYISERVLDNIIIQAKQFSEKCKAENQEALIIIDYLQSLKSKDGEAGENMRSFYTETSTKLKDLAKDTDTPVIVPSSINRDSYNEKLTLSSLKETGELEASADLVIGLNYTAYNFLANSKNMVSVNSNDSVDAVEKKGRHESYGTLKEDDAENTSEYPRWLTLSVLKNRNGDFIGDLHYLLYNSTGEFKLNQFNMREFSTIINNDYYCKTKENEKQKKQKEN